MLQVTPALAESFATVAVNPCDPPPDKEAVDRFRLTLMAGVVGVAALLPQPIIKTVVRARQGRGRYAAM